MCVYSVQELTTSVHWLFIYLFALHFFLLYTILLLFLMLLNYFNYPFFPIMNTKYNTKLAYYEEIYTKSIQVM